MRRRASGACGARATQDGEGRLAPDAAGQDADREQGGVVGVHRPSPGIASRTRSTASVAASPTVSAASPAASRYFGGVAGGPVDLVGDRGAEFGLRLELGAYVTWGHARRLR